MASAGLRPEKYTLTSGLLGGRYVWLPLPGPILELVVTNLRNRPLCSTNIESMRSSFLSLYHSLVTGSKDFPLIPFKGFFCAHQAVTSFAQQSERENMAPTPLMEAPAGSMVPPAGSSPPNMLTPVLPERPELGAPKADRRKLTTVKLDGHILMSVLCGFTKMSVRLAMAARKRKRKDTKKENSSSRQSPPMKRLRL